MHDGPKIAELGCHGLPSRRIGIFREVSDESIEADTQYRVVHDHIERGIHHVPTELHGSGIAFGEPTYDIARCQAQSSDDGYDDQYADEHVTGAATSGATSKTGTAPQTRRRTRSIPIETA